LTDPTSDHDVVDEVEVLKLMNRLDAIRLVAAVGSRKIC
jgi:hypothetical protein